MVVDYSFVISPTRFFSIITTNPFGLVTNHQDGEQILYIYIHIYIWGSAEKLIGSPRYPNKMGSNEINFFNIVSLAVHTHLPRVFQCLDPIGQKSHPQHIWRHHIYFFLSLYIYIYIYIRGGVWGVMVNVVGSRHTHTHTHTHTYIYIYIYIYSLEAFMM